MEIGGEGGIRTHVPLRTTAFRVRLVMTTSILLHVGSVKTTRVRQNKALPQGTHGKQAHKGLFEL